MRDYRRVGYRAAAFLLAGISCGASHAAVELLVQTEALTASREPAGVFLQLVHMPSGAVSRAIRLPGVETAGEPVVAREAGLAAVTSALGSRARPFESAVSGVTLDPFGAPAGLRRLAGPGWLETATALLNGGDGAVLLLLGRTTNPRGVPVARVSSWPYIAGGNAWAPEPATWSLPGPPTALAVLPGANAERVAVLCSPPGKLPVLALLDPDGHETARRVLDQEAVALDEPRPGAVAVTDDGEHLAVLVTGYERGAAPRAGVSRLLVFDAATLRPAGAGSAVPGEPFPGRAALYPAARGRLWILTRHPGASAYASRMRFDGGAVQTEATYPLLTGVDSAALAVAPRGHGLAVAAGPRLEVWPRGAPADAATVFDAPAAAVSWNLGGLFAGEAGRVHEVNPGSGQVLRTVQLQTGHVTALVPVKVTPSPHPTWARAPVQPSPAVHPLVSLPPGGAAPERRYVGVGASDADEEATVSWRVAVDENLFPWLRVAPTRGEAPGGFEVWVEGGPSRAAAARLDVRLLAESGEPLGDARRVLVTVPPAPTGPARVLWLLGRETAPLSAARRGDGWDCGPAQRVLAGPPSLFTHQTVRAPYPGALSAYPVAVVTLDAAARGFVTRPALLDYVSRGGGLLFVAGDAPGAARAMDDWLEPLGVTLGNDSVSHRFPAGSAVPGAEFVDFLDIERGRPLLLSTEARGYPHVALEPGEEAAVLLARPYGQGRVAVLASDTPLTRAGLARPGGRLFAHALFGWLAYGDPARADVDGDLLPNAIEDRDGDRTREPGETDYRERDSDGDGLPDGIEDANGNGMLDPGETAALNPDSDGDGIADPADASPLPPPDAPRLGYAAPGSGPGEGGVEVRILGLNLPETPRVWFGDAESPALRPVDGREVIATVPPNPLPEPGTVALRLGGPNGGEARLPDAFAYGHLSAVRMRWEAPGGRPLRYPRDAGALVLTLRSEPGPWAEGSGRVVAMPPDVITFETAEAGTGATGEAVLDDAGAAVRFQLTRAGATEDGPALLVRWRRVGTVPPFGRVTVRIENAAAESPTGVPLRTMTESATLYVR